MTNITVYRIFDEDFTFFGDEEDIYYWLLDSQIEYIRESFELDGEEIDDDEVEKRIREKGWAWGLEQAGVNFEEIYSKEFKKNEKEN